MHSKGGVGEGHDNRPEFSICSTSEIGPENYDSGGRSEYWTGEDGSQSKLLDILFEHFPPDCGIAA
jgi:hypothetical protein